MTTIATTVRIPGELQARYDRLAQATGRSQDFLMADALERYVADEEWRVVELQATMAKLAAGEMPLIPADELIARHLAEGKGTREDLDDARVRYGVS